MARNGATVATQVARKEATTKHGGPNDFVGAKVHRRADDGIEKIAKVLSQRAQDGLNMTGVRVELGKAHLWDLAVEHLAKEFGVEL